MNDCIGVDVRLAHCLGVRLLAESRLKTDKVDAWVPAQLLRSGFLPEAYLAPTEVRDNRMLLRHRQGMVSNRTAIKTECTRCWRVPTFTCSLPGVGKLAAYYLISEIGI